MTTELQIGDEVVQMFGPYKVVATVVEIKDAGAILSLPETAELVGDRPVTTEDGTELTTDPKTMWIGRAHWPAAKSVS